jgi:protein-tyrosine phosphatase
VIRVLFVCLGNICRSPMADGVLGELIEQRGLGARIAVDSCGTSAHHVGELPDSNMRAVARGHGVDLSHLRSRKLQDSDFFEFDLIVAMDRSNERDIKDRELPGSSAQLVRFMDFVPGADSPDVPDPYYGGREGFEHVYELIVAGCPGVLERALQLEADATGGA